MNCEGCTELLADFLLDELPEAQAVLVQEHLNLCPACMKTYKELKGTGKALEAVPVLRPVRTTEDFGKAVRAKAAVELDAIVARLPPEKRLRLEARREARRSRSISRPMPVQKSVWANPLVVILVVALLTVGAIIAYTRKDPVLNARTPLGRLSLTNGKADQFYQRQNEPHSPARVGRDILPGDAFLTSNDGCARFEMVEGGTLFLGPNSSVNFRAPERAAGGAIVNLEQGEIGIQRGKKDGAAPSAEALELRVAKFKFALSPDAHVYVRIEQKDKELAGSASVLAGSVQLLKGSEKLANAVTGNKLNFSSTDDATTAEPLQDILVPAWRHQLATETDLSAFLDGYVKIISRGNDGVEAEFSYGFANKKGRDDWSGDGGITLNARPSGVLVLPRGRLKHDVPFAAPLTLELALNADSQRDTAFAFGVLENDGAGTSIDVAAEAVMQVKEKGRPTRSTDVAARKPSVPERLRLDITREGAGWSAVLSSSGGKSKVLQLPKDAAPGDLWLQSLGEGILLDEIKISGVIPAEWLRQRLGK